MKNKIFCEILAISIGLLIVAIAIVGSANATNNTTHIVINAFDQNPEGKIDHLIEWVTLYNPTNNSVNITGWTLSSRCYRGRSITIKNSTIPPKNFWTYVHGKRWLRDNDEQITLKDPEGKPIDETLEASDTTSYNRYWARHTAGFDTDSDSDWRFGLQTLEEGVMRRGTVIHVHDGDTMYISPVTFNATEFLTSTNNGGTIYISPVALAGVQSVRLDCIDAPELGTPEGNKSKGYLENLSLGKEVEFDVDDCRQYDKYNRILALVYLNGTKLNEEMLRNDYADFLYIPFSEFVPHANFTYSPLNPVVNQSITFDASSSQTLDPYAAIISYEWDFGDGTDGTGKIVNHTYPSPGSYVVSLKVTDSNSDERRSNIRNKTITVMPENKPPIASFTYSPPNPIVNQTITFDGSNSTDPDGTIEEYEWDFGDGEKAEGKIVNYSYSLTGNYTAKLTVTDDKGAVDSTTEPVHVAGPPTVSVKTPTKVSEGENFTATVNIDNAKDLAILLFKLTYDPSVIELIDVESGAGVSGWSHWYSSQKTGTGTLKVFAFSDLSGLPINGSAELAKLEFEVVGRAGNKSSIDIQGFTGNSDIEAIESKWVDSAVSVI